MALSYLTLIIFFFQLHLLIQHNFAHLTSHTLISLSRVFLLVSDITKNLIYVSQFAKDNNFFFEFHSEKCLVKSHASSDIHQTKLASTPLNPYKLL